MRAALPLPAACLLARACTAVWQLRPALRLPRRLPGAVLGASPYTALPPPSPAVVRILSVPEEGEVAVVGTLYKEMKLKPSILDE